MTKRIWRVTLYNQAARAIYADGPSREKAFIAAMNKAGEAFVRYGGDNATTYCTLWREHIMRYNPHSHYCAAYPHGAGVELRRIA